MQIYFHLGSYIQFKGNFKTQIKLHIDTLNQLCVIEEDAKTAPV